MNNEELKQMCLSLLTADSEQQVERILKRVGYWDKSELWRYYGDKEDNFSTIGNQQSRPEAALVEKIVNSVDAVLMNACWLTGISPTDKAAPEGIHEAVGLYFGSEHRRNDAMGHIEHWPTKKRTDVSRGITVTATGTRQDPCFTISDAGEGQTPSAMPTTLLDLNHKNKLGILFVQGKFNMGSTGVLQFCGRGNLQLVISRRNPAMVGRTMWEWDESDRDWGFTVVRREDPLPGRKSSAYTYLAPLGGDRELRKGGVLHFRSDSLPIFPDGRRPYGRGSEWGTCVKLYQYAAAGFRTNMMMRDGLLSRLDILLPEIALPIRLHECRDYRGHTGSFETTVSGLTVRLQDNRAENLEEGFPATSQLMAAGERMTARIYAFKKGRAETYRKNEGIIFTVNGQTHAHLPLSFFGRKSVGMGRLDDSILVVVDCTSLRGRAREDLFMNSRDRLRSGDLREAIERELEILIREHSGLRDLRERRRSEEISSRLADSRPLEEALKSILRSSPSLSSLFLTGVRLPNPLRMKQVDSADHPYKGKPNPTYFKFQKLPYGRTLEHRTPINMRCRITFETDVENDYFDRLDNRGEFSLRLIGERRAKDVESFSLNLQNGKGTLSVKLPQTLSVGAAATFEATVSDDTLLEPFANTFVVTAASAQETTTRPSVKDAKPPDASEGHAREAPTGLAMPEIHEVYETHWDERKPKFDRFSALQIVQEAAAETDASGGTGAGTYSFWVNMDNVYLKTEMKASKTHPAIVKARFTYGLVLMGMAMIQEDARNGRSGTSGPSEGRVDDGDSPTLEDRVFRTSAAIAPVLLPLVESLGSLTEEQVAVGSQVGDDE